MCCITNINDEFIAFVSVLIHVRKTVQQAAQSGKHALIKFVCSLHAFCGASMRSAACEGLKSLVEANLLAHAEG